MPADTLVTLGIDPQSRNIPSPAPEEYLTIREHGTDYKVTNYAPMFLRLSMIYNTFPPNCRYRLS